MDVKRNTGLDFLRVIAILIITMSHMIPGVYSQFYSGLDSNYILFVDCLIKIFGQIGNAIFIIVSSYFLISSKLPKLKNILFIIMNSYFFLFLGFGILKLTNYLAKTEIGWVPFSWFRFLFPILTSVNWFILPYLLMYIFHPLLNKIVNNYEKKDGIILAFVCFVFFLARFFILVFTDYGFGGDNFLFFILTYLLVGYALKFNIVFSKKKSSVISITSFAFIIGLSYFIKYVAVDKISRIPIYTTCFAFFPIILIGYSLFCIFKEFKINNYYLCKIGENSLIGYLFINNGYLIAIGSTFIYGRFCEIYFQPQFLILYWVLSSIMYFLALSPFILLYDVSLKKLFKLCSAKIENIIFAFCNRFISK